MKNSEEDSDSKLSIERINWILDQKPKGPWNAWGFFVSQKLKK